jgi:uncharacterized membrane protein
LGNIELFLALISFILVGFCFILAEVGAVIVHSNESPAILRHLSTVFVRAGHLSLGLRLKLIQGRNVELILKGLSVYRRLLKGFFGQLILRGD